MSRTIHVIQGLSAGGSFVQAMHPQPGELLVNEDVLSCGPLPPLRSIEEWAQLRKAYWDSVASSDDDRPFNRDLLANSEALRNADSVMLWLGIGAAEQLLTRLGGKAAETDRITSTASCRSIHSCRQTRHPCMGQRPRMGSWVTKPKSDQAPSASDSGSGGRHFGTRASMGRSYLHRSFWSAFGTLREAVSASA